jgi:hypothetical protein
MKTALTLCTLALLAAACSSGGSNRTPGSVATGGAGGASSTGGVGVPIPTGGNSGTGGSGTGGSSATGGATGGSIGGDVDAAGVTGGAPGGSDGGGADAMSIPPGSDGSAGGATGPGPGVVPLPGKSGDYICPLTATHQQCCEMLCECVNRICTDSPKAKPGLASCMSTCMGLSDMLSRCHVYHCYESVSPSGMKDHDSHCGHAANQVNGGGCPPGVVP